MKQVVRELHQHNQSAAQLGFTSLTNENVNNTPAAAWRECYAINVSHAFFPVDLQVINWFLWLLNKQKKKEIIKLLSHNYVLLLHAVSCGHTASLIEITATHTNLAGLSELWQVTRAATWLKPWRQCALPETVPGDERPPGQPPQSQQNPQTDWVTND